MGFVVKRVEEGKNRLEKDVKDFVSKAYWYDAKQELRRQLGYMSLDMDTLIAASGDKLQGLSALRWLLVPVEAALCGCLLIPAVHLLEAQEAIGVDTSSTLQAVVGLLVSAVFAMSVLPMHRSKRIPAHYKGRLHFVESREPLLSLPVPLVEDDAMFSTSSSGEPEPFKWMLFLS